MPNIDRTFFYKSNREIDNEERQNSLTQEEANKFYLDEEYQTYFVEYVGDISEGIKDVDFANLYILNRFFAVLFVKKDMISEVLKRFPQIINLEKSFPFTLLNMDESNAVPDLAVLNKGDTPLDGEGVIVGIISTGIDYLNPAFMKEDGSTRIISIWDQSLNQGPLPEAFVFGTEFTMNNINNAIKASKDGKNPYDIVNHKDEVGNGTAAAGIIGGSNVSDPSKITSLVPKCEFCIVKLKRPKASSIQMWGLENYQGNIYDSNDITASFRYFDELQAKLKKPMVVYIAAGTNLGGHDGGAISERYIDYLAYNNKFTVITSTGDQGASPVHFKGSFLDGETEKEVEITISEEQENINFFLYFVTPDRISIGITSPTGKSIEKINVNPINGEVVIAAIGESIINIQYFTEQRGLTEEKLDQRIDFFVRNATAGIWKIKIYGDYLINRVYDLWLQQRELLKGNTGFINATTDTTLMTPSTANNIIVCSSYNQLENKLLPESGRGFTRDGRIIPTVAVPAKNIEAVGLSNKPIVISGTGVAGAFLTGLMVLIFQWGIVLKNDENLYSSKIKSYLIMATSKVIGQSYPNPETGFGILYAQNLLEVLRKETKRNISNKKLSDGNSIENKKGLFINIPEELYERLNTN